GGEHVGGRALGELRGEGGTAREGELHGGAGVLGLEPRAQFAEDLGEGGGGEHGEGPLPARRGRTASAGGARAGRDRDAQRCDKAGESHGSTLPRPPVPPWGPSRAAR